MAAAPLQEQEFADRLAAFAPFERRPRLAVGVSGGADSLALVLLAASWARARGGETVALTVDHGLRAESAAEAAQVGAWLAARGIPHRILRWTGPKPRSGLQAAARAARRALLLGYCRENGILHLLLGHQQEDQAETLLLRLAAGSGRDGLAAMSAVIETAQTRILRPLLDVPHARLAATLMAAGQSWVEDPSNRDLRYTRTVIRNLVTDAAQSAATARGYGEQRIAREAAVAELLARAASVRPEGWATLDPAALAAAPPEIGRRALARVLMCVAGGAYPPRGERLDGLYQAIAAGTLAGGRTLAGCRVVPWRGELLVVRELAAVEGACTVRGSGRYAWDGRFVLQLEVCAVAFEGSLGALGTAGWSAVAAQDKSLRKLPIPPAVRPSLPALFDLDGVREVPHLMYRRRGADPDSVRVVSAVFRPDQALAGAGFAVFSPFRP